MSTRPLAMNYDVKPGRMVEDIPADIHEWLGRAPKNRSIRVFLDDKYLKIEWPNTKTFVVRCRDQEVLHIDHEKRSFRTTRMPPLFAPDASLGHYKFDTVQDLGHTNTLGISGHLNVFRVEGEEISMLWRAIV